jgi:hypothetical protein
MNHNFTKEDANNLLNEIKQGKWAPVFSISDFQPNPVEVRQLKKEGLLLNIGDGFFNITISSVKNPTRTLRSVPSLLGLSMMLRGLHQFIKIKKKQFLQQEAIRNEELYNEASGHIHGNKAK